MHRMRDKYSPHAGPAGGRSRGAGGAALVAAVRRAPGRASTGDRESRWRPRRPGAARPARRDASCLGGVAERRDRVVLGEAPQGLLLELADALAREPEPAAGLAQGLRLLAIQSEAERQHGPLVLREC